MIDEEDLGNALVELFNKPKAEEYKKALDQLLRFEDSQSEDDNSYITSEFSPTGKGWEPSETPVSPIRIGYFKRVGVVTEIYKTNKYKYYCLTHPDIIRNMLDLDNVKKEKLDQLSVENDDTKLEISKMWQNISGYDDIKFWLKRFIQLDEQLNAALMGEAGTAKTLFLRDIGRLENGVYIAATHLTKAGMWDLLTYWASSNVKNIAIDEADELRAEDWGHIYTMCWDGYIEKHIKNEHTKILFKPSVFLSLNIITKIPKAIRTRFVRLFLKEYTEEEFKKHAVYTLMYEEGVSEELAEYIVNKLSGRTRQVRDAVIYGRACKTDIPEGMSSFELVDKLLKLNERYDNRKVSNIEKVKDFRPRKIVDFDQRGGRK